MPTNCLNVFDHFINLVLEGLRKSFVFLCIGYLNNKEATSQTFQEDGWVRTGDLGYYNENYEVFVVDRIKELIKYKGFQVQFQFCFC